jgi:hypothetical protein
VTYPNPEHQPCPEKQHENRGNECPINATKPRAITHFYRIFLRFTVEYIAKQRSKAASRSSTGASGEHELGDEFNGYSMHSENGKGCEGPDANNAISKPSETERIMVMITPIANRKSLT